MSLDQKGFKEKEELHDLLKKIEKLEDSLAQVGQTTTKLDDTVRNLVNRQV
jgi:hypothetical protein